MRIKEFDQPRAAGCVLYAEDTGRWGLQQRSDSVSDPGIWSTWGGGRKPGETLEQCVRRELAEEGGYVGPLKLEPLHSTGQYATFIGRVPHEFEPSLNGESKSWCWVNAGDWPQPIHDQLAKSLVTITPRLVDALANKWKSAAKNVDENFADGKKPGRKGLAKRMGVPTKASVSKLRSIAKSSSGEKARMAHWMANMKSGKKK